MTAEDKTHLVGNIVAYLGNAAVRLQWRQIALFFEAGPEYRRLVAKGLALDIKDVEALAATSQEERVEAAH